MILALVPRTRSYKDLVSASSGLAAAFELPHLLLLGGSNYCHVAADDAGDSWLFGYDDLIKTREDA